VARIEPPVVVELGEPGPAGGGAVVVCDPDAESGVRDDPVR
jgi:hypothetical protein